MASAMQFSERRWRRYRALLNTSFDGEITDGDLEEYFHPKQVVAAGAGRANVEEVKLPSGRRLIVRRYFRGGIVRFFFHRRYLRPLLRTVRPFAEAKVLAALCDAGANVPLPVAAAVRFDLLRLSYVGYLATVLIEDAVNMRLLAKNIGVNSERQQQLATLCFRAGVQAWRILRAGYYHPDLHLGNVLAVGSESVWIVDLDRARRIVTPDTADFYIRKLLHRWQRYAHKLQLEDLIVPPFRDGLVRGALIAG